MFRMCNCGEHHTPCCKKNLASFLAGAATFSLIKHIIYHFSGTLPITMFGYVITPEMNTVGIGISALITAALFYWISTIHCESRGDRNRSEQNRADRNRFEQDRAEQHRNQ